MAEIKKTFLVVDDNEENLLKIHKFLGESYDQSTIFTAKDGNEGLMKLENAPPQVLITALDLPKRSGTELVRIALMKDSGPAVVILSDIPEEDSVKFENQSPRVQFIQCPIEKIPLLRSVNLALTLLEVQKKESTFRVRYLAPNEILFREGDVADSAFLLKKGNLRAVRREKEEAIALGEILPGEFVGEMAHITGGTRSADIEATENSELIEIPLGTLDILLFSKPAWSRALMKTLAQRLKAANIKI